MNKTDKPNQNKDMNVEVTAHAIERYRQRTLHYNMSVNEIVGTLKAGARRGTIVKARRDNAWEVKYQKVTLIVEYNNMSATVITCLGKDEYRNWDRHSYYISNIRKKAV